MGHRCAARGHRRRRVVGAIPRSALDRLIATVLDGNLDLQAAAERVKQAQALTVQKRAVLLPELDATAHAADARQNTPPPLGYVRQAGAGPR